MRRKFLIVFLTMAASVISGSKAAAQEVSFKGKTIKLIAGYPSGGGVDAGLGIGVGIGVGPEY